MFVRRTICHPADYSRGVRPVGARGQGPVRVVLLGLPRPPLVLQDGLDSGRLVDKVVEPCVPDHSVKRIPVGQDQVALPARLNMRTAQRLVQNQQNIVLRIDARIIVEFLVLNPLSSHYCWSIETSLAFPFQSCTYEAAPPHYSRRTCFRSGRARQEFRPWCHLEVGLEQSIILSRRGRPMVCIAGQQEIPEQKLLKQMRLSFSAMEVMSLTSICQKACLGPMRHKFRMVRVGVDMALQLGCGRQREKLWSAAI
jgi:hypothetical protein